MRPAPGLVPPGSKRLHLPAGTHLAQSPHGGWGAHGVGGGPTAHLVGAGAPSPGHGPGVEQGPGCPPGTHRWGGCRRRVSLRPSHPRGRSTQWDPSSTLPAWIRLGALGGQVGHSPLRKRSGDSWKGVLKLRAVTLLPSTGLSRRAVLGAQRAAGVSEGERPRPMEERQSRARPGSSRLAAQAMAPQSPNRWDHSPDAG